MSVVDSILDMKTHNLTIRRRAEGVFDADGIWQPGAATSLTVEAVVQPATGMQRVVGGRDMRSDEYGQHTDDVRVVYTPTLLLTRDTAHEPDQVLNLENGTWTVIRAETYQGPDFFYDDTDVYYRVLITRETRGAS